MPPSDDQKYLAELEAGARFLAARCRQSAERDDIAARPIATRAGSPPHRAWAR